MQSNTVVEILLPIAPKSVFLIDTLTSIVNQSYRSWTVIAIVDELDIETISKLNKYIPSGQLKILGVPTYFNLPARLNAGLDVCSARFIARVDADDTYSVERISRQVEFLQSSYNKDVGIVGTFGKIINERSLEVGEIRFATSHQKIVKQMMYRNALIHPSVMFRKSSIQNLRYDINLVTAQDYSLWLNAISNGVILANIPDKLIHYRVHQTNSSKKKLGFRQILHINYLRFLYVRKNLRFTPYFIFGFFVWSLRHLLFSPNHFK